MSNEIRRLLAVTALLPLAFAACGPDVEDDDLEAPEAPAPVEATVPAGPISIALMSVGGSGVEGEAAATHDGDEVMLRVALMGLMDGEEYEATVHEGTCAAATAMSSGAMADEDDAEDAAEEIQDEAIAEIEFEAEGMNAIAETTIDADDLPANRSAYIAVWDDDEMIVACGDIQGHGG